MATFTDKFVRGLKPAEKLYEEFITLLADEGLQVETGQFGAKMLVSLENDGPVTIIVDTPTPEQS